jgi:hypothetical protein
MSKKFSPIMTPKQYSRMEKSLSDAVDNGDLFEKIVNLPFSNKITCTSIDLGIVVLLQINHETKTIDRVALSDTELAKGAVKMSAKQFSDIRIPISEKDNIISAAIRTKAFKFTEDWAPMFNPALTPKQARLNQANAGIECSLVYPITSGNGGALIFSFYQPQAKITNEHLTFVAKYAELVDTALSKAQPR